MKLLGIVVVVSSVLFAGLWASLFHANRPIAASTVLGMLDPDCLGCGPDKYSKESSAHPMAFALIATAGAKSGNTNAATAAANWLVANSTDQHGATGWGLGFAWDAFNDGSENPPDTIYGITTALAVAGLVDAYESTKKAEYLSTAVNALEDYARYVSDGCFWYSNQRSDSACVHNVSAMLMGQYARVGALAGRDDFIDQARNAHANLLDNMRSTASGEPYWSYSTERERPNDAVHAAYVVQGLAEYARATGTGFVSAPHIDYLTSFIGDGAVLEFSPHHKVDNRRARLWGVGQILYTLSDLGRTDLAARFITAITSDYTYGGRLVALPEQQDPAPVRMVAHVVAGMARYEREE